MLALYNNVKVATSTTGTGTLTAGAAVTGFQTPASAGVANGQRCRIRIETSGGAWELSTSVYTTSGTTFSRTLIASSTGSLLDLTSATTNTIAIVAIAQDVVTQCIPQGRLTLTTATPVMTASATAQTTVYYSPYNGSWMPTYDGTSWTVQQFAELSQATTDSTKSPAACTTNSNYDIFGWDDSGTLRATRGPAWTSDTARGTGAGTTELTRVNGILVNANAITNGPGANKGTYLGTIRTNGSSQVDMTFGGTGAAGGESTILGVWNAYNRILTPLVNYDTTDSWTYTTATWRLKNAGASATANRILFVTGLSEDVITAVNAITSTNSSANIQRGISIGLNSTSAYSLFSGGANFQQSIASGVTHHVAHFVTRAPLGLNYIAPLEISAASGTSTWYGDNGANGTFTGQTQNGVFSALIPA